MDVSYLKPMLCASADAPPQDSSGVTWMAEPKLDGWRFIVVRSDAGLSCYGGRNGTDYSGMLPYLEQTLDFLPVGTILDGELTGTEFAQVQGVMKSNVKHTPSAGDPPLTYVAFDMLAMGGRDMRKMKLADRRSVLETFGEHSLDYFAITPRLESTDKALNEALAQGFEGLVCKQLQSTYVHTRSPVWVKVKPQETAEAKVIGFKAGQGKYAGMVGALELEMVGSGAKTRASGFDDDTRRAITADMAGWLGKVVEIKHHGIGDSGVPRHPQFLRVRDEFNVPAPKPRAPRPAPRAMSSGAKPGGWSKRNYGAMHDDKLIRCIRELEARSGDAYQRVLAKNADPDADLAVARNVAAGRSIAA